MTIEEARTLQLGEKVTRSNVYPGIVWVVVGVDNDIKNSDYGNVLFVTVTCNGGITTPLAYSCFLTRVVPEWMMVEEGL